MDALQIASVNNPVNIVEGVPCLRLVRSKSPNVLVNIVVG